MNSLSFTDFDVIRSLGSAVILALNGRDPEQDYGVVGDLPHLDGRIAVEDSGQTFPLAFGGFGSDIFVGVTVEVGVLEVRNGKNFLPTIVSVTRSINDQPELELKRLENLCKNIRTLIFETKQCPIYLFDEGDTHVATQGRLWWHDVRFPIPPPRAKLVTNNVPNGWYRKEFHITCVFTR